MIKIDGLENIQKKLNNLEKRAHRLNGTHNVPIKELLTRSFLTRHTRFSSVEELFKAGGFHVKTNRDINETNDYKRDQFIRSVSRFANWNDMLSAASKEWVVRQLDFK